MEREDFLSAAIYNNRPFIEEWLKGQTEEAIDKQLLGELLRKAAQYGSISVVELLLTYGMQEILSKHDSNFFTCKYIIIVYGPKGSHKRFKACIGALPNP